MHTRFLEEPTTNLSLIDGFFWRKVLEMRDGGKLLLSNLIESFEILP